MENQAAGRAVITWLRENDEEKMVATFDRNLVVQFGVDAMKRFVDNGSKHKHGILHVLAWQGKVRVLKHLVQLYGFDMDVQRASDNCTPLHVAAWCGNRNVTRVLRQLGADPSIHNSYGEVPDVTAAVDKPIKVRILGATSIEDILQVVAEELGQFNRLDGITAFYQIARMSSDYDAEFCNWSTRGRAGAMMFLRSQRNYVNLLEFCADSLCTPWRDDSVSLWRAMLKALAMLPDPDVIMSLSNWLGENPMPCMDMDASDLAVVAWGLAKIENGKSLWRVCHDPMGDALALKLGDLAERELNSAVWAFAAAGSKVGLRHPSMFRSVAARIASPQRPDFVSAQACSILMWSFAKMGERMDSDAFHRIAAESIRLMPDFLDQNVANTAWAMARLQMNYEPLLAALMGRAGETLYNDVYRHHVRMSDTVKKLHWFQIYTAYMFCRQECPTALQAISEQLARDLGHIDSGARTTEGLSQGSGLESVDALRELDIMINEMEAGVLLDGPTPIPEDSMEAATALHRQPEAANGNAQRASDLLALGASDRELQVVILKFARSPEAFRRALLEGPELRECRDALEEAGFPVVLEGSAAKIFTKPLHYLAVVEAISTRRFYSSHVIVEEEFGSMVQAAISSIRSNDRVVARARAALQAELPRAWDEISERMNVRVERTFITVRIPADSLFSESLRRGTRSL
ncbi:unnamed protein product [Symbiodinium sp. CCMP2456]|nr:unnamed protein product [Symbiodinium sp. CCMP2456]